MNTLDDIKKWVDDIMMLEPCMDNIDVLKSFIKFSPEKAADKLGIERSILVNMFNNYKRIIHNKIIIFEKSQLLKSHNPNNFGFYYDGNYVRTIKAICIEYLQIKFKGKVVKFYPDVKYLYYGVSDSIIIFPIDDTIRKIYITKDEFYDHFKNLRDYKISKLISNSRIDTI